MYKVISFLFIAQLLLVISCKYDITCPAFDKNDAGLIPYKQYDTLAFTNSKNETYSIYIKEIYLSETYEYVCKTDFKSKCVCLNTAEVKIKTNQSDSTTVFLTIEQSNVSDVQYYKYQLLDFYFEFDFINELPYIDDFEDKKVIESLTIGNKTYKKVIEVSDYLNSSKLISKVYFNQYNGILKYIDKNKIEWVLQIDGLN